MNTLAHTTTRSGSNQPPFGNVGFATGTSAPHDALAARRRALPRSQRHPLSELGLGTVLMLAMLCASAVGHAHPQVQPADPPRLIIETCTFSTQSCVGEAEQAHVWLPPGAGARALLIEIESLRSKHGLAPDVPARLTCATGQPDRVLIKALQGAGYRLVGPDGHTLDMTQAAQTPSELATGATSVVSTVSAPGSVSATSLASATSSR